MHFPSLGGGVVGGGGGFPNYDTPYTLNPEPCQQTLNPSEASQAIVEGKRLLKQGLEPLNTKKHYAYSL